MKTNNRGFTIVDLMVSLGVLSVLLFSVGYFAENVLTTFGKIDKTKAIADSVEQTRIALSNADQCSENFKGKVLTAGSSVELNRIDLYRLPAGGASSKIVEKGERLSGALMDSIRLKSLDRIELGTMVLELELNYSVPNKPPALPTMVTRRLPLMATINIDGAIENCWVRKDSAELDNDKICAATSDGFFPHYDEETGECFLEGAKWFDGSPEQASCGGGYVPVYTNKGGCGFDSGGFDGKPAADKISVITYSDGSTGELWRPHALPGWDSGSNSCVCDLAADLSSAVTSTFKCRILCKKP